MTAWPRFVLLWTDAALWLMVLGLLAYVHHVRRHPALCQPWQRVFSQVPAVVATVVLAACLGVTLLDSVHLRRALPAAPGATTASAPAYEVRLVSVLDLLLARLIDTREATYSGPLAYVGFTRESVEVDGQIQRIAPRLRFGGAHLQNPAREWVPDVLWRGARGLLVGWGVVLAAAVLWGRTRPPAGTARSPRRAVFWTLIALATLVGPASQWMGHYHVLGTDSTGNDVLYQALKSLRTAFVIGSVASLAMLPLAVGLGLAAGYLRGWVDAAVQYLYTVLSSVPNVLLIAACVLMLQAFLDQQPDAVETGAERADLKLLLLCLVLGLTGWTALCRLVRAETLKLRELDYMQAAQALGVSRLGIMRRHLLPNVTHLVLIMVVLEFSSLVLYEAVLSYVGIGVDPTLNSFGGMINLARSEMSRDPVVWWRFTAAFGFMVTLVLAAHLLADAVREAFDPRAGGADRS